MTKYLSNFVFVLPCVHHSCARKVSWCVLLEHIVRCTINEADLSDRIWCNKTAIFMQTGKASSTSG